MKERRAKEQIHNSDLVLSMYCLLQAFSGKTALLSTKYHPLIYFCPRYIWRKFLSASYPWSALLSLLNTIHRSISVPATSLAVEQYYHPALLEQLSQLGFHISPKCYGISRVFSETNDICENPIIQWERL